MLRSYLLIAAILVAVLILWVLPAWAQVDTAWVRRYDGPAGGVDYAFAIAVDGSGNAYVNGLSCNDGGPSCDYATIRYDATGHMAWVRRHAGPNNAYEYDWACIDIDAYGNVYVTGETSGNYLTIKYYPNGDTAWMRSYNGSGNGLDQPMAIAVDDSGNVHVTGLTGRYGGLDSDPDYLTLKYDTNGILLWARRYDGLGNTADWASDIAVDASGNVYVTGQTMLDDTSTAYGTVKYSPGGSRVWARTYYHGVRCPNCEHWAQAIAVDSSGNVYVTGHSSKSREEPDNLDFATIKYYPGGGVAWTRRYNGPGNGWDGGGSIAVDDSGNVYVMGSITVSGSWPDAGATIKYFPNGGVAWVRIGDPGGTHLDVDSSGNAYVVGYGSIMKYSANGDVAWAAPIDWWAVDLALHGSGNFYVTGFGQDYTTAKFGPSTWTVMVYMDGDNNLSSAAFKDVNEMELGTDSRTDVTCVVLYDSNMPGGGDSRIYRVEQDTITSAINSEIIDDGGTVIPPGQEVNMGDPNTLKAFTTWAIEQYPAHHYVLIMWDHGSGWQKDHPDARGKGYGLCIDETNNNDRLYIDEIKSALASITQETGITLDLIGFDACSMGMLENAYQIRDFGKVMVASEEYIPGDGWDYDSTLLALSHSACWDAESLGIRIVKDFIRSYTDGINDPLDDDSVTLAAIDLARIEDLAAAVSNFGESLDMEWPMLKALRDTVEQYSVRENVDLFHLASLIALNATDPGMVNSAQDVMSAIEAAVIFDSSGSSHLNSHGVSIYFPDSVWRYNSMYEDKPNLSRDTFWDDFLRRYNTYSAGEGPTSPIVDIPFYAPIGETFDVSWAASFDADQIQCYKLVELENVDVLFLDDAEDGDVNWDLDGFSMSTTLTSSPTHSFFSNPPNEYDDNVTNTITLNNPIAIPEDSTVLSFWCKWEIQKDRDFLYVEVATERDGPWTELGSLTGVQGSAHSLAYDLSAFSGSSVYVRFRYVTDYAGAMEGFYVDDIKVESIGSATALSDNISSLSYSVPGKPEGRYYYQLMAKDELDNWGYWSDRGSIHVGGYMPGDATGDGVINVADVVLLVNFLYRGGDPPNPIEAGDANCDGIVNVGDVVYLVNYLYRGGDPPGCP